MIVGLWIGLDLDTRGLERHYGSKDLRKGIYGYHQHPKNKKTGNTIRIYRRKAQVLHLYGRTDTTKMHKKNGYTLEMQWPSTSRCLPLVRAWFVRIRHLPSPILQVWAIDRTQPYLPTPSSLQVKKESIKCICLHPSSTNVCFLSSLTSTVCLYSFDTILVDFYPYRGATDLYGMLLLAVSVTFWRSR